MQHIKQLILIFIFPFIYCQAQENQPEQDYVIEWEKNSLVCIANEGAYPRLLRLHNNSLLVVYENRRGDVVVKKSTDNGTTWSDSVMAYERFDFVDAATGNSSEVNIANPEIIQLDNGNILMACNLRPRKDGIYRYSIAIKRSEDNGNSWSDAQILFAAAPRFIDGCWEPSFLLLPDGTIQIYFANEFPYRESDEQEISVISSADNGKTWSKKPLTVSFRKGFRDGMPVAVHDATHIFVAIEDNVSGQFKPYIVRGTIENAWQNYVQANSPDRYSALENPLSDTVYAGAPYLIRTDKGIYVLSYQTTENRTTDWEFSTMEVAVSETPSGFRNPSQPFNVPLSKEAKWNSLADLGNNTIAALTSTNFNSDKIGIWMIKGKIIKK